MSVAGPNKCSYCDFQFSQKKECMHHVLSVHPDVLPDKWASCSVCDFKFPHESLIIPWHTTKIHGYRLADGKILCAICDLEFATKDDVYSHCNESHAGDIKVWRTCKFCEMSFPPDAKHIASCKLRIEIPKHICTFCRVPFVKEVSLITHVNKKHAKAAARDWMMCIVCCQYFPDAETLSKHMGSGHKEGGLDTQASIKPAPTPAKKRKLQKLKLKNQSKSETLPKGGKPPLQCIFCSVGFETDEKFHEHAYTVHKDIISRSWLESKGSLAHLISPPASLTSTPVPSPRKRVTDSFDMEEVSDELVIDIPESQTETDELKDSPKSLPSPEAIPPDPEKSKFPNLLNALASREEPAKTPVPHSVSTQNRPIEVIELNDEAEIQVYCHLCGDGFESRLLFLRHSNLKHIEQICKSWQHCSGCLWYFPSKKTFRTHECAKDTNALRIASTSSPVVANVAPQPVVNVDHEAKIASTRDKTRFIGRIKMAGNQNLVSITNDLQHKRKISEQKNSGQMTVSVSSPVVANIALQPVVNVDHKTKIASTLEKTRGIGRIKMAPNQNLVSITNDLQHKRKISEQQNSGQITANSVLKNDESLERQLHENGASPMMEDNLEECPLCDVDRLDANDLTTHMYQIHGI